ncbi:MAG: hypothetical protein NZT92_19645 [Abditibacteriales bacterium]|nr:hypothetical protein [Abditibacteriales bacterium]
MPINEATLPLLLTAKGKVERKVGEYLVGRADLHRPYLMHFARLHIQALMEVLAMRKMTPEEIGVDIKDVIRFIEFMGEERILRSLGEERILRSLDEERILRSLGKERILRSLGEEHVLDLLGEERVRRWLAEREKKKQNDKRKRRLRAK